MKPRPTRKRRVPYLLLLVLVYGAWATLRPLPALQPQAANTPLQIQTSPGSLAWPIGNQAAVGVMGDSSVTTYGPQTPAPIASVAKVITALTILDKKPLPQGQPGPTITLTENDLALYRQYVAADGSVSPVATGEQITEYQALEAILLPSANNVADSLASWAFGSLDAYSAAANSYLQKHGLKNTHVGTDASGFSPSTTSTAHDLVLLGKLAMDDPVIAEIVAKPQADDIPLAGTVKNVNILLGSNDIVGIKTGNTDTAGGVFVGAAKATANNKPHTVITAVVGAPNLAAALQQSARLLASAQHNFATVSVIKAGSIVGHYQTPHDGTVDAVVTKDLNLTTWSGSTVKAQVKLLPLDLKAKSGQQTGTVETKKSSFADPHSVPVALKETPTTPSITWRLTHPF